MRRQYQYALAVAFVTVLAVQCKGAHAAASMVRVDPDYGIQLPPPEYDHEPTVPYTDIKMPLQRLNAVCKGLGVQYALVYGCALPQERQCIIITPDVPEKFRALIVRHEKAHCNGWVHE